MIDAVRVRVDQLSLMHFDILSVDVRVNIYKLLNY